MSAGLTATRKLALVVGCLLIVARFRSTFFFAFFVAFSSEASTSHTFFGILSCCVCITCSRLSPRDACLFARPSCPVFTCLVRSGMSLRTTFPSLQHFFSSSMLRYAAAFFAMLLPQHQRYSHARPAHRSYVVAGDAIAWKSSEVGCHRRSKCLYILMTHQSIVFSCAGAGKSCSVGVE